MATFGFVRATTTRFHEPRGQYRQTRNERDFGMDVERRQCSGKEGHSLVDEDEFRQKYRVSMQPFQELFPGLLPHGSACAAEASYTCPVDSKRAMIESAFSEYMIGQLYQYYR